MSIRLPGGLAGPLAALVMAVAFPPVAHGIPLTYFVDFSGGPTQPTRGLFTYDASTSTFSNFLVSWNHALFDLTGAANAPTVGTACPGTSSSGAASFALMTKSLCAGLYDRWFAGDSISESRFSFSSQTLALPEQTAARIATTGPGLPGVLVPDTAAGDWTLSDPFPALAGTPTILSDGTVLFPGGGVALPGSDVPIEVNYLIGFTGGPNRPDYGAFNYDASTSKFSNFLVSWDGTLFDLTSAANAPSVGAACPGTTSSAATGFALMNKTLCAGLYDRWFAGDDLDSSRFAFSSQTLALPELNAARIGVSGAGVPGRFVPETAIGEWTITFVGGAVGPSDPTDPTPPGGTVPEPSTLALFGVALSGFLLRRTSPGRGRSRSSRQLA